MTEACLPAGPVTFNNMDRLDFLKTLGLLPLSAAAMKLEKLNSLLSEAPSDDRMPILFLGHGNPMYAIQENDFTRTFKSEAGKIEKPRAIICISAHWETAGTFVTAMPKPTTIHDFGGFPQALFDVQYPASGDPLLAEQTAALVKQTAIKLDHEWGLDHGTWSVLRHLYPNADIPVLQLSLDYRKDPAWHYALAKELSSLRRKGVLIIGSGNIVHNLSLADFRQPSGYSWAVEADEKLRKLIANGDHASLINYRSLGKEVQLAIPTPDHYLPLLYILGLKEKDENPYFFNDKTELGSISMTSVRFSA